MATRDDKLIWLKAAALIALGDSLALTVEATDQDGNLYQIVIKRIDSVDFDEREYANGEQGIRAEVVSSLECGMQEHADIWEEMANTHE